MKLCRLFPWDRFLFKGVIKIWHILNFKTHGRILESDAFWTDRCENETGSLFSKFQENTWECH